MGCENKIVAKFNYEQFLKKIKECFFYYKIFGIFYFC